MTHRMRTLIDRRKASTANLIVPCVPTYVQQRPGGLA